MTRFSLFRRVGFLIPVAATVLAVSACGSEQAEPVADESVTVQLAPGDVASATRSSLSPGIIVTGSLDPSQMVNIKAQISGTVRSVRVDRGSRVRRGQVLATIDAAGVQGQALGARAAVAAAEAGLAVAQQRLDAAKTLHEAGAMSSIDFRGAQAEYEAAVAQLAAAKAQSAAATESESHATVVSPIDGFVSSRTVEGGESVMPDAQLFMVVNADTLELKGQISVAQAASVKVGQRVIFTIDAIPGKEFTGRVSRVDPMADLQSRQVGVYVQLLNRSLGIVGGQFARGRIIGEQLNNVVVIPQAAIRGTSDNPYVFIVDNGVIAERKVTLGLQDQGTSTVAVMEGLQGDETVIVAPSTTLTAGTKATLLDSDQEAASQETPADTAAADSPQG